MIKKFSVLTKNLKKKNKTKLKTKRVGIVLIYQNRNKKNLSDVGIFNLISKRLLSILLFLFDYTVPTCLIKTKFAKF